MGAFLRLTKNLNQILDRNLHCPINVVLIRRNVFEANRSFHRPTQSKDMEPFCLPDINKTQDGSISSDTGCSLYYKTFHYNLQRFLL